MKKRSVRRRKRFHWGRLVIAVLVIILVGVASIFAVRTFHKSEKLPSRNKSAQVVKSSGANKNKASRTSEKSKKQANQWLQAENNNQLPILMFHYVSHLQSDLVDSNWMPTATFEADLQALKKAGYTTVTADKAERILTTKEKPSNKMVWLTFDDGSLTLYRDIFPLLKKYNMHATAFIVTGFVDNGQPGIVNWQQIKEMKDSGLIDFGSHTVSHLDLGTLSTADATTQLSQSKAELDKQLNQKTTMICYPAGGYNQQTLTIAKSLGYQYGFLDPGRNGAVAGAASLANGLMTLPRFRMASTSGAAELMEDLQPATDYNLQNIKK